MAYNNRERRWSVPNKRAESYAQERRARVHQHGQKEGKQLTDYEAGMRSGYLQCQSDHAGIYKYKKAEIIRYKFGEHGKNYKSFVPPPGMFIYIVPIEYGLYRIIFFFIS